MKSQKAAEPSEVYTKMTSARGTVGIGVVSELRQRGMDGKKILDE